ncbi:hypothetical protein ABG067_006167 [Albugo candida]
MGSYVSIINDTPSEAYCRVDNTLTLKKALAYAAGASLLSLLLTNCEIIPILTSLGLSSMLLTASVLIPSQRSMTAEFIRSVGATVPHDARDYSELLHATIDTRMHVFGFDSIQPKQIYTSDTLSLFVQRTAYCYNYVTQSDMITVHVYSKNFISDGSAIHGVDLYPLSIITTGSSEVANFFNAMSSNQTSRS